MGGGQGPLAPLLVYVLRALIPWLSGPRPRMTAATHGGLHGLNGRLPGLVRPRRRVRKQAALDGHGPC